MQQGPDRNSPGHSEIMVDTDYFFDVSFKTFGLVLKQSRSNVMHIHDSKRA